MPIGPSVWQFSQTYICDPLKPLEKPPVVLRGELYLAISIPRRIRRHVPNLVSIGRAVWQLPRHLNLWPPKPPPPHNAPWGIVGRLVFSLCPFPDESADVNQSWCKSVQPFDSFSRLLNVWPLKTPMCPLVSRRAICLAFIHSQMNLHMCAKFGANRSSCLTASTDFWICDPLKPPKCPLGYWGANCI